LRQALNKESIAIAQVGECFDVNFADLSRAVKQGGKGSANVKHKA